MGSSGSLVALPRVVRAGLQRSQVLCATALALLAMVGPSRAEPPIQGPQDSACRNEARAKVFTSPDPQGLGFHAVGRQIYTACMNRSRARTARRRRP